MKKNIELLSPVGDFEMLKAAVQNGADSVYFGGTLFNARSQASNFDNEKLKEVIDYCLVRNVKTNLTLNILLKQNEFEDAANFANYAYSLGIDAIIVQDLGFAKYLIDNYPDLPVHASTQMTIHNLEGAIAAKELGFKRVVLSRELSISEITHICSNTDIEIETFVHGALCISYSGQCLFSSTIGGRSGNRGKCAQPCRLPYSLINENNEKLDNGYLLSPKDLCGLEFIPDLIESGVICFKIEGRLKSPQYVATVTRIYRKYIDLALSNKDYIIDENDKTDLLQVFNRGGFSSGHLSNHSNDNLMCKDNPSNTGIYIGNVANYNEQKGHIKLTLENLLELGDSVSFENENTKYSVSELMRDDENILSGHLKDRVLIGRMKGNICVGDKIYKMASKKLNFFANKSYEGENKKILLDATIDIRKCEPICLHIHPTKNSKEFTNYKGIDATLYSDIIPVEAKNAPITIERVISQIAKTSNTPFEFNTIKVNLDDKLYIPSISSLNELRRKILSTITNKMLESKRRIPNNNEFKHINHDSISNIKEKNTKVSLTLKQININYDYTNLNSNLINRIYLSYNLFTEKKNLDIITYLSSIYDVYIYMPTIIKSNFRNVLKVSLDKVLSNFKIKGFVLSNLGDFELLKEFKDSYDFIGNSTLNVFNSYSIEEYLKLGLSTLTYSRELSSELVNNLSFDYNFNTELIVYGFLPVMTMSYCPLGSSNKCVSTCNTKCSSSSEYYLKDKLNYKFRVIPDNTLATTELYNSRILSISSRGLNIDHVRIDILEEDIEQINTILEIVYNKERLEGLDYTNGNFNKTII